MKFGNVIIIGKPNVGKSSLINSIFNNKISIISSKPQTTRNVLKDLLERKDFSIMFYDTPGYHAVKNKLDLFLNSQITKILKLQDVTLFLCDPTRSWDEEDRQILKKLNDYNVKNIILVITKMDLISNNEILEKFIDEIKYYINPKNIIKISSLKSKDSIDNLLNNINKYLYEINLKEYSFIKKEDFQNEKFIVSEIIRETIINNFRNEIPYSVAINIEEMSYNETNKLLKIYAFIIAEKESQKPILIGKNGSNIKKIGILSRNELEKIYDCKIFLSLNVKVKDKWRNNNFLLKELGYGNK